MSEYHATIRSRIIHWNSHSRKIMVAGFTLLSPLHIWSVDVVTDERKILPRLLSSFDRNKPGHRSFRWERVRRAGKWTSAKMEWPTQWKVVNGKGTEARRQRSRNDASKSQERKGATSPCVWAKRRTLVSTVCLSFVPSFRPSIRSKFHGDRGTPFGDTVVST